jgi:phosphoenolpyruvate carboxylase
MRTASERAWRDLVTTPGFAGCFAACTPIEHIATLPIASRPVSRAGTVEDLDALRAIPWVFSWAQARVNLPGWFGLGSGLEAAVSVGGIAPLRRLFREWPFFAVVLENASLSLAKADRGLATVYLERAGRPDVTATILGEWDRTEAMILRVTGEDRLLADRPSLRASIDLRAPYVSVLSHLQLEHLGDPRGARVVQATIGGVAAGLQNTG